MSDYPDENKLSDSYAAMTTLSKQRQRTSIVEMSLVAAAAILVAISTMFGAWNTWELRKLQRDQVHGRQLILLGTECIVEQMSAHRHLTGLAHREAAKNHGYTYPIPLNDELPVAPGVLENVCATFVQTTTTSRP